MRAMLGLTFCAMGLLGCFEAPKPKCIFLCGANGACPAGYACGADDRCHLMEPSGLAMCEAPLPVDSGPVDGSTAADAAASDASPDVADAG